MLASSDSQGISLSSATEANDSRVNGFSRRGANSSPNSKAVGAKGSTIPFQQSLSSVRLPERLISMEIECCPRLKLAGALKGYAESREMSEVVMRVPLVLIMTLGVAPTLPDRLSVMYTRQFGFRSWKDDSEMQALPTPPGADCGARPSAAGSPRRVMLVIDRHPENALSPIE